LSAIVFIAIILFLSTNKETKSPLVKNVDQNINQEIIKPAKIETKHTIKVKHTKQKSAVNTNQIPAISYSQALKKYKDARIQLGIECQAFPNNVTYKNGTSIMIDNRSAFNRKIKIGSFYTVKAYDFKIIKLSSSVLPIMWLVDCDKLENNASILVQR